MDIKKILESVLAKYLDFVDIFLKKLAMEPSQYLGINKYTIKPKVSR